jgi:Flp pilus assembly protein TadG
MLVDARTGMHGGERGAVLVEFAFTLPLLLFVLVGILDFGWVFQQYQVVTNAAREGARMAVLPGYVEADVQNRVAGFLSAGGVAGVPTTTVVDGLVTPGAGAAPFTVKTVTVTVDYTFKYLGAIARPFGASFTTVPLKATSQMRTEVGAGAI